MQSVLGSKLILGAKCSSAVYVTVLCRQVTSDIWEPTVSDRVCILCICGYNIDDLIEVIQFVSPSMYYVFSKYLILNSNDEIR